MNKKTILLTAGLAVVIAAAAFMVLRQPGYDVVYEPENNQTENVLEEVDIPSPDGTIEQTVGALSAIADNENWLANQEDDEDFLTDYGAAEVNNLIETYDENEF